eukprot:GEZU01011312.1.p1 GENE.GEZU01011312.1~~GEZU01011312.1.p1  ORF type:complete len:236 (-),score=85.08 GEZU01011312.1:173-880(-)
MTSIKSFPLSPLILVCLCNVPDLKKSLYMMFSQFGPILDVVASRTLKLRGQAWVAFKDINAAAAAIKKMNGFYFYEKPMVVEYAKSKSDAHAKLDGTYPEQKRKRDEMKQKQANEPGQKKARETAKAGAATQDQAKRKPGPPRNPPIKPEGAAPVLPNKVLFVQNLPATETGNQKMLEMLFQNFAGFKSVTLVPGRNDIAFVEFENEAQATIAMTGLQGFKITPTNLMQITYAKQ